jgi:biopolymer transport protein ExbB
MNTPRKQKVFSIVPLAVLAALVASGEVGAADANRTAPATRPAETRPNEKKAATRPGDGAAAVNDERDFSAAAASIQEKLERSTEALNALEDRIKKEKLPLTRTLNALERELRGVRESLQEKSRAFDNQALNTNNLEATIEDRRAVLDDMASRVDEYVRNFESRLHITEVSRFEKILQEAKAAPKNDDLSRKEKLDRQIKVVRRSVDRLDAALGGVRFTGQASGEGGVVKTGTFALVGPMALFRSTDGKAVGAAQVVKNSVNPVIKGFRDRSDAQAVSGLIAGKGGKLPLDPTLGKAAEFEAEASTLWGYAQQGGPVMVPIVVLAGSSFLVAMYKWVALMFVRKPSQKQISEVLRSIGRNDEGAVRKEIRRIKGPVGRMLHTGVEHMREPRELIEEVMYEKVLSTRLKVQRLLPFISITAVSSPLLGLLGTVIGIIETFEVMNVSGAGGGDMQSLAGGISEALITTASGLIVAIPSLLLYAFLSRKARTVTDQMEQAALAFTNQVVIARVESPQQPAGQVTA